MGFIQFLDHEGTFSMKQPENYNYLYFPIAGEKGIKGAVSPNLGGDIKLNQNAFLMEPVSVENLHNNRSVRNFWCRVEGKGIWSAVGASAEEECRKFTKEQDDSEVTAGFMWHTITRQSKKYQLKSTIESFVPLGHNVEIMHVTIENTGADASEITPVAAIPVFGRSADNIRDHRHVTSLLHRIRTEEYGVLVKPTLSFDERGHQKNQLTYFICGVTGTGEKPVSFYPVTENFIGEGGSLTHPRAVLLDLPGMKAGEAVEGKEALGGIRFAKAVLQPGESVSYTVVLGITDKPEEIDEVMASYDKEAKVAAARNEVETYWKEKVNVGYHTGNIEMDSFMRWVSFQPFLRRIYGCSFLPHHDYGRGGRGWRDLWQDCLSLLIMDPGDVRQMILDNYGGVRIDGTNATIIGEHQGEFIADRNGIARVWMDHGVWPFMTTKLYIDQTGDIEILKEKAAYFKDEQKERGTSLDKEWDTAYGVKQKTEDGTVYQGTILEHLLLQHLCSFYEVGAHNHIRLRGADWNDALDMASENGESVAFTCAYAGNLNDLADLLDVLEIRFGWKQIELLQEIQVLLRDEVATYEDIDAKHALLKEYLESCGHNVSGKTVQVEVSSLAKNLRHKAAWMQEHIRKTEWIQGKDENQEEGWFNSYYDNHKQAVEGYFESGVRMMLTGQVFSIMSRTALKEQVAKICKSADRYLYRKEAGGYRLNTNFHEEKFDLGRMFGFAYGEKENGAVFSHMTVMYANALYQRGFVKEGHIALSTLAENALNFETSKIYPGIPEYFDASGRGLYHYLTGAASWYMLTYITEVFGVKGKLGALTVNPKLVKEQFDRDGNALLTLRFADKSFRIQIKNPEKLDYDAYKVKEAVCDDHIVLTKDENGVSLSKEAITGLDGSIHTITVTLGA
ncbi:GH36-type glycosyl hydrolase domain-containing protein [[Clostridium] polysaccharolyticum]|nr:cellobiose phosphorylase [[Clostridium] polysaccharolyticum]